jgi:succinate dehydrogenase / fumarate reductase membrane anchor subunit
MRETKWWTWHIAAGAIILIVLALHMLIMHLSSVVGAFNPSGGEAIAWANVLARSKMLSFVFAYILLLGAALYHGLYGFRTILFELGPAPALQKIINVTFWIGGLALFALGTGAAVVAKML